MEEDINIVNTNTKFEKIKSFLVKNKKIVLVSIIAIILLIIGYFFIGEINQKKRLKLADAYNISKINFDKENEEKTKNEMIKIIEAKDKTYSPLALYFLIDNNISVSTDKINKFFDIIINETNNEKEVKNLIIYKKALYNSDFSSENNLLEILNPIINSESIWKSHALYLLAEYFYSKNEKQKAKEFFQSIVNLGDSNPNIKSEAQKRISRDFSE
tara:strand:- start:191 stop:835 length:645 start_codon:yes stop_codon:yes gene_type:complete